MPPVAVTVTAYWVSSLKPGTTRVAVPIFQDVAVEEGLELLAVIGLDAVQVRTPGFALPRRGRSRSRAHGG